jgi:hypothetical protein
MASCDDETEVEVEVQVQVEVVLKHFNQCGRRQRARQRRWKKHAQDYLPSRRVVDEDTIRFSVWLKRRLLLEHEGLERLTCPFEIGLFQGTCRGARATKTIRQGDVIISGFTCV